MNIIMLGAPGAGKGTQAEIISEKKGYPQISTGNVLREAVKNGTEYGKKAKQFMDEGKLVPDEIIISIIKECLSDEQYKNGFILDGVPRTVAQAEALDKLGVKIDLVLDIEVSDDEIISRLTGRRVCGACGASYHTQFKPSAKGDKCEKCDGELVIRKDDSPETVVSRLKTYHEQTEPLKEFYAKTGKLREIKGEGDVSEITKLVFEALEA
ncbi:MAG: adenylate kinase [Oscillospiraceae bacterium]|nr:adenylate kinase [Oscillospiraceae bacterium]